MAKKLSQLRVVDLRTELEKRGLDKSGLKSVLVERLEKSLAESGDSTERSDGTDIEKTANFEVTQTLKDDVVDVPTTAAVENNNTEVGLNLANNLPTEIPTQLLRNDMQSEQYNQVRSNYPHCNLLQRHDCGCQCRLFAAELEGLKLDVVIMQKNIQTKTFAADKPDKNDEIGQLKQDLFNEREKCKCLEADISILVRGRSREMRN